MTPKIKKIFVSMPEGGEFGISITSLTDSCLKEEYTAYLSQESLVELLKGKIQELVMNTMYDGSMGVMVDPDLSVYNELQSLLDLIELEKE
jgi:hypothetical protein